MNLREFLSDPAVRLPIRRCADDFQRFVEGLLDTYIEKLALLTEPADIIAEVASQKAHIASFCQEAKEAVRAMLAGHPSEAYSRFVGGLIPLLPYLDRQALRDLDKHNPWMMYRVRPDLTASLSKEQLFHIPFESRHKVKTQRYSIPGLPCLYLGGSLYTCWAEMTRPPFHELHAAAFWIKSGAKVALLNLSDRPTRLLLFLTPEGQIGGHPEAKKTITTHLVIWPLLALSSIVVKHRDAPYKAEYIIPQLLLEWITREVRFDGICYFSTHVEAVTEHPVPTSNFVFPAQTIRAQGRCSRLRDIFKMTTPQSWQLLSAIKLGERSLGGGMPLFEFEFVDGYKEMYYNTEFGRVQHKLNRLAFEIQTRIDAGEPDLGDVAE